MLGLNIVWQNKKRGVLALCGITLLLIACLVCFFRFESESRRVKIDEDTYGSDKIVDPSNYVPCGELTDEKIINGYTIRLYSDFSEPFTSCMAVVKGGEIVFVLEAFRFFFGDTSSADQEFLSSGIDLLGDGSPNLVVTIWTGGAHGMFYVNVFSLGDTFKYLGEIDTLYGGGRGFVDCDNRYGFEYEVLDWNFANWNCCFADSPAPRVILHYSDGEFLPDLDLMRGQGRIFQELEDYAHGNGLIVEVKAKDPLPKVKLWSTMLDLIYSGNMADAWRFFYYCWPGDNNGERDDFLKEFILQLKFGQYWVPIWKLNEHSPGTQYLAPELVRLLTQEES